MSQSRTVLSRGVAEALVGLAVDQNFLPADMLNDGHEDEAFLDLQKASQKTTTARELALQILLTSSRIAGTLPMYEMAGEAFAFRTAMKFLEYRGLLSDLYDPDVELMENANTATTMSVSSHQLMAELANFEMVALEFYDFYMTEPSRFVPIERKRVPPEEAFGMYAYVFLEHLAHVVFRERRSKDDVVWKSDQQSFVAFLKDDKNSFPAGEWQRHFRTLLAPVPFLTSTAIGWIEKRGNFPFDAYDMPTFKYLRVRPLLRYHGTKSPWIFAKKRDEVSALDMSPTYVPSPDRPDLIRHVRLQIGGDDPVELADLSLEEALDLRREPQLHALQSALSSVYSQISGPPEAFDVKEFQHALGEIKIIREKAAPKKYGGWINRILTYGGIPVMVIEQITYGGGIVGASMSVAGTALQLAQDANQLGTDSWLIRLPAGS